MSSAPAFQLSVGRIRPTGGRASIRSIPLTSARSLKVRTSILGALSPMAAMPPSCPSRACSCEVAACAGYAATRSEDLVDQIRIMVDAIGADGALRITPAAMVRLCATGQALLDDIATFGLRPTSTVAASVITSAPDAT